MNKGTYRGQKKTPDLLVVVSCLEWVLGAGFKVSSIMYMFLTIESSLQSHVFICINKVESVGEKNMMFLISYPFVFLMFLFKPLSLVPYRKIYPKYHHIDNTTLLFL